MQLVSMKLENERTVGVTVTRERSDLNMNQNISNVTANSGDLSRISAIFAMLSAKSQNINNFNRIISDIKLNVRYPCCDISKHLEYRQY